MIIFASVQLNFKPCNFTIKNTNGNALIFDIIRKKYVALTPEEWVRQHVLHFLTLDKGYGAGLISVEKSLKFNSMTKRFDVTVADRNGSPYILVECKAPHIKISNATLQQAGIYQRELKSRFVFITNGLQHVVLELQDGKHVIIDELPASVLHF